MVSKNTEIIYFVLLQTLVKFIRLHTKLFVENGVLGDYKTEPYAISYRTTASDDRHKQ